MTALEKIDTRLTKIEQVLGLVSANDLKNICHSDLLQTVRETYEWLYEVHKETNLAEKRLVMLLQDIHTKP